jgi:hypothetical protein
MLMPRPMNKAMLNVICAVQARKALALAEMAIGLDPDWIRTTRAYYYALPSSLLGNAGFRKNAYDFEDILAFEVTREMGATRFEDLGRFSLPGES